MVWTPGADQAVADSAWGGGYLGPVALARLDLVAAAVGGTEGTPPDGRLRAVGRAAALAAGDQAEAAVGQGRERLRVVGTVPLIPVRVALLVGEGSR
jgi:hypothetical protein